MGALSRGQERIETGGGHVTDTLDALIDQIPIEEAQMPVLGVETASHRSLGGEIPRNRIGEHTLKSLPDDAAHSTSSASPVVRARSLCKAIFGKTGVAASERWP